jgi:hypothetical protein
MKKRLRTHISETGYERPLIADVTRRDLPSARPVDAVPPTPCARHTPHMATTPDELTDIEVALLGVMCVGLPPSKAAGDDSFRVDHVTAVVAGLKSENNAAAFLGPDRMSVSPAFRLRLRAAIIALTEKGIVADQPAGMPAAPGGFEAGLEIDMVNPDEHPAVMDHYLAQLCMEALFNVKSVYPYLMDRYAQSGEHWRRLRADGYGQ